MCCTSGSGSGPISIFILCGEWVTQGAYCDCYFHIKFILFFFHSSAIRNVLTRREVGTVYGASMTMPLHSTRTSYKPWSWFNPSCTTSLFNYDLDRRRESAGEQRWRLWRGTGHPQHLRHVLDQRLHRQRRTWGLPLWSRGMENQNCLRPSSLVATKFLNSSSQS